MAMELARLIEKTAQMDIKLVSGEKGLHHIVTWVHMVESVEATEFLDRGQLAFVTGIGLHEPEELTELLKIMQEKGLAGVIVNTGPFIERIPDSAIRYCEEQGFPLFAVPWKEHLAEIMRICCYAITREEQRLLETSAAFKNAIFFPDQEELYLVPLSHRSFQANWRYSVTVMRLQSQEKRPEERLELLRTMLERAVRHSGRHFAIFPNETELVLILADVTEAELQETVTDLRRRSGQLLARGEELSLGVGRLTRSVRCLYKSYRQAKAIQRLQAGHKISTDQIFYTNLGIYRLLIGIEDREIMTEYYAQTIKPLAEYDEVNQTDLCRTLKSYLTHNGSVRETAEELFVHRNTVNYKLNKIRELLGADISSLNTRMELMLAFDLQDIL